MKSTRLQNLLSLRPFQEFFKTEAGSGILLIVSTVVALIWANSALSDAYEALWKTYVTVGFGAAEISKPLLLWVNDGLMAIFFFVVGLEIKRELLSGELSTRKKAALPIAAAIGGAVLPALIYVLLNLNGVDINGWGVPMATDIAFAIGVLALLGSRAPLALKIFVTALAIVDDLMAVLVIAIFYTAKISFFSLAIGFGTYILALILNRFGVHRTAVYVILGIITWVAFLKSGVHATVAGVLFATAIPTRTKLNTEDFLEKSLDFIRSIRDQLGTGTDQRAVIHYVEETSKKAQTPLERMEHALHGWVAFGVMPIFALANAGVAISGEAISSVGGSMVFWGIFLGLLIGKPIGIFSLTWLAIKTKIAELPTGITWRHIAGAGALAGIGFTMALFIANLAFEDAATLEIAKMAILSASLVSGILGWILLSSAPRVSADADQEALAANK
ncbi:MAG: Na+/H+ antiporter NhaA [Bacteroidota bacterium]